MLQYWGQEHCLEAERYTVPCCLLGHRCTLSLWGYQYCSAWESPHQWSPQEPDTCFAGGGYSWHGVWEYWQCYLKKEKFRLGSLSGSEGTKKYLYKQVGGCSNAVCKGLGWEAEGLWFKPQCRQRKTSNSEGGTRIYPEYHWGTLEQCTNPRNAQIKPLSFRGPPRLHPHAARLRQPPHDSKRDSGQEKEKEQVGEAMLGTSMNLLTTLKMWWGTLSIKFTIAREDYKFYLGNL